MEGAFWERVVNQSREIPFPQNACEYMDLNIDSFLPFSTVISIICSTTAVLLFAKF